MGWILWLGGFRDGKSLKRLSRKSRSGAQTLHPSLKETLQKEGRWVVAAHGGQRSLTRSSADRQSPGVDLVMSGAGCQREHMTQSRMAILPDLEHYDVGASPRHALLQPCRFSSSQIGAKGGPHGLRLVWLLGGQGTPGQGHLNPMFRCGSVLYLRQRASCWAIGARRFSGQHDWGRHGAQKPRLTSSWRSRGPGDQAGCPL